MQWKQVLVDKSNKIIMEINDLSETWYKKLKEKLEELVQTWQYQRGELFIKIIKK